MCCVWFAQLQQLLHADRSSYLPGDEGKVPATRFGHLGQPFRFGLLPQFQERISQRQRSEALIYDPGERLDVRPLQVSLKLAGFLNWRLHLDTFIKT